ncbi:MAG: hypothetical protein Q8R96_20630 [Bacteroidota bacterium]|nr:hypothetical protein [Bacteroidota bacterium]
MQIVEIKVSDLPDFVKSELWQQLTTKPLTVLRAISQFHNPRANPNDIALIFAHENGELLGLAGILPNLINGQVDLPASSNTCWWVHPEKGKKLAFPLFMKAFAVCGQRMFMTDCTPHTISILKETNWFEIPDITPGIRGFLKFNLHELIPAKLPSARKLKPLLKLADQTFNFLIVPYKKLLWSRVMRSLPEVEYLNSLDQELHTFIELHTQNEFIRRTGKDLEWILKFPWITGSDIDQSKTLVKYPFSHIVESFEQYFVKITASNQTIGLLLISVRDGHMKIPYAYFQEKDARMVLKVIYQQALRRNVVTLTVFNPVLVNMMDSVVYPFIFKKKIKRLVAISKNLFDDYQKYPLIQDGDGDIVFT